MPHLHFMMDAYGSIEENANNLMSVNELLNGVTHELGLIPVMPPFLVPYYYCNDSEDVGISAFTVCRGGHVTIHTFPYRACYFVDILTDEFFTTASAESFFKERLFAKKVFSKSVDRRMIYDSREPAIDTSKDFGPHYMIEVKDVEMTFEGIYRWLDTIAPRISMLPIIRPYAIYDSPENPEYISGVLVVAQSHIAVHYNLETKIALIDIFSCEFLDDATIRSILQSSFGTNYKCYLVSRGSKHDDNYRRKTARLNESAEWKKNI